jgi:opacity protein-like surface antigen
MLGLVISVSVSVRSAYAETYIGGQVGTGIANMKFTEVQLTDFSPPGSMSDRSLASSGLAGVKLGYYFPRAKWFGVETEAYYMTPHIKQQTTTISVQQGAVLRGVGPIPGGTTSGVLSGDYFRVLTWVPVNAMFRYYKTRLQPYFGIGPAVFVGSVSSSNPQFPSSQTSTRIGLNVKGGAEYYFTRRVTAFAELKWNYVKFDFSGNPNGGFGFKATYSPLLMAVGISYHF